MPAWGFKARKGDNVAEKFRELAGYINNMPKSLGPDIVKAASTSSGTSIVSTRPRDYYPRPFLVRMTKFESGNIKAKVEPGKINGKEPTISGMPISGDQDTGKIPELSIPAKGSKEGSWVVIKVTVNAEGAIQTAEIEHSETLGSNFFSGDASLSPQEGKVPIAFVKRNKVGDFQKFMQNTTHHLMYKVVEETKNNVSKRRHFFYAI